MNEQIREVEYLRHMLQAVPRIRRYSGSLDEAAFRRDEMLQDAIIRNIEIVGEAANRISPEFAARFPTIPWRDITGMRHRLNHGYMSVNLHTVWNVVDRELPVLETNLRGVLAQLGIPLPADRPD